MLHLRNKPKRASLDKTDTYENLLDENPWANFSPETALFTNLSTSVKPHHKGDGEMEFTKVEIEVIQQLVIANDSEQIELNDLQLALVGGGSGETSAT